MALENSQIVRRFIEKSVTVRCPYGLIGAVMALGERLNARVMDQTFTDTCTVCLNIRASQYPALHRALDELYGCEILP
jgi:putative IMPACT (imprinted ancient) family translation regulator